MAKLFDKANANNSVQQRTLAAGEYVLYAILPAALIAAGALPAIGLFFMPVALVILYILFRRFGIYLPLFCVAAYGSTALVVNYDILTVIYFCALCFGFSGLVFSCQISPYLACAACCAVLTVIGAVIGVGTVRIVERKPIGEIAKNYVINNADDPVIKFFAYDYFDAVAAAPGEEKPIRGDAGYSDAAIEAFSDWANEEMTYYIWYYCIHYGAVFAAAGFFAAAVINNCTASAFDTQTTKEELQNSTRALGGVKKPVTAIADMRLPRTYLWTCLLPAAVTAIILDIVGGYAFIASTVMHLFVTVPSAFGCYTLFGFFASLFKGKAKGVAVTVVTGIGIVALVFPFALFIISLLGVCDCILNLRYWTLFIKED